MKLIYSLLVASLLMLTVSSCATRVRTTPRNNVTVIKVAPKGHKVVRVKGKKYYTWSGKRYRKTNRGYILVR